MGAERFSAAQHARMLGALGALRYGDELVADMLARNLVAGVGELQADELRGLAAGLLGVGHSPGVLLLDAMKARLAEVGLPEAEAQEVEAALGSLGHDAVPPREAQGVPAEEQPDRARMRSQADYL
jgi:hypothetical protein